jgi:molybdate transport system regulatory protein
MTSSGPQLRLRIDFAPGCSVGPGKVGLLEAIQRSGSLSEAARQLDMSYRRAWLLLDELNRSFSEPLVSTAVGGANGGGALLTPAGLRLIKAFRSVEQEANALIRRRLPQLLRSGLAARSNKGAKPRARRLVRRKSLS